MKALSIRQPWAWAIVHGFKPIENRSWKTNFRGEFYVHAAKTFDKEGYKQIKEHQKELGISHLPKPEEFERGGIVGTATVTNCVTTHPSLWFFGDYGFVLENAKPISFIPCKGKLNFFKPDIPSMSKIPRFLHMANTLADDTREFIVCTRKPACVAKVFEVDEIQLVELQSVPPPDWFLKIHDEKIVIAAHTRLAINKKHYVLVAREFFTEPTARDIPIEGSIVGGVMSRMCDWFFAYKKNELKK